MHTGDGIQRVSGADAILTPNGGEGGSVPQQALGSKAEERAKRRKKKKDSYAEYLESPTWRKIRARALRRDKNLCHACGEVARVVHHRRYPKNLGQEKMEWLFSLCVSCHDAIHRAAESMPLRSATDLILGTRREGNVVYLPDDWQLSKNATRERHLAKTRKGRSRRPKKVKSAHLAADKRKKQKIEKDNAELHAIFKANRERRERRWETG